MQMQSTPEIAESSEDVLHEPSQFEEVKVIVSPKSSMISSRLAEPETAETMTSKLVDFWNKNENNISMAREKTDLQNKKDVWASGQSSRTRESQEKAPHFPNQKRTLKMPTKQERNDVEMRLSHINT